MARIAKYADSLRPVKISSESSLLYREQFPYHILGMGSHWITKWLALASRWEANSILCVPENSAFDCLGSAILLNNSSCSQAVEPSWLSRLYSADVSARLLMHNMEKAKSQRNYLPKNHVVSKEL